MDDGLGVVRLASPSGLRRAPQRRRLDGAVARPLMARCGPVGEPAAPEAPVMASPAAVAIPGVLQRSARSPLRRLASAFVSCRRGADPALGAAAGALGTAGLVGVVVEAVAVSLGAPPPAAGGTSSYAIVGAVLGGLLTVGLVAVRRGRFGRLRLPSALRAP